MNGISNLCLKIKFIFLDTSTIKNLRKQTEIDKIPNVFIDKTF